jgi:hypothetical protein
MKGKRLDEFSSVCFLKKPHLPTFLQFLGLTRGVNDLQPVGPYSVINKKIHTDRRRRENSVWNDESLVSRYLLLHSLSD